MKTKKSRRSAESRPVCLDLYTFGTHGNCQLDWSLMLVSKGQVTGERSLLSQILQVANYKIKKPPRQDHPFRDLDLKTNILNKSLIKFNVILW